MTVRACRRLGGFDPDLRHSSNDLLVLLELVRSGGCVSLLPELIGEHEGVVVRTPAEGRVEREVFALTRPGARRRPAVAAFLTALHQSVAAL